MELMIIYLFCDLASHDDNESRVTAILPSWRVHSCVWKIGFTTIDRHLDRSISILISTSIRFLVKFKGRETGELTSQFALVTSSQSMVG